MKNEEELELQIKIGKLIYLKENNNNKRKIEEEKKMKTKKKRSEKYCQQ